MTETTTEAELRELRKMAGEMFLAGHLEKHDMEQVAVQTALAGEQARLEHHRTSHSEAHAAHEKLHDVEAGAHQAMHDAEERAVKAAVSAMDKRLDGMNEFRDQLRDQAGTFVRTPEMQALEKQFRSDLESMDKRIDTEREERREQQSLRVGTQQGISQSTAFIVGAVGLVGAILGVIVIVSNFLTP